MSDDQVKPNLYELSCDGVEVTYSTSGVGGRPTLSYKGREGDPESFTGDDIALAHTRLGIEATVVLIQITRSGLHQELTVVLPDVTLREPHDTEAVKGLAIVTRAGVVGSPFHGAPQTYAVDELEGTAKAVEFAV